MATEKCGDWHECRDTAAALHRAICLLEQRIELLDVQAARDHEWYALLTEKLLPQLGSPEFLVVAVTGGTNTGKSSVFNQLAGTRASSASPLAAGTRHPVCLVPSEFSEQARLQQIFPEQRLQHWQNADDALRTDEQNLLFWRECAELPGHLLLLDTPDIDSDARVNWKRTDSIRRAADVIIAVLTQQKYNDAVVREFFRRAAAEGRTIIPVFNQVLIPEDEPYWPVWLQTFCEGSGVVPEVVFLAPADRRAAAAMQLPFSQRWMGGSASADQAEEKTAAENEPEQRSCVAGDAVPEAGTRLLLDYLRQLPAGQLRLQSLRGSLDLLCDPAVGIPEWLRRLRQAAERLQRDSGIGTEDGLIRVEKWPAVPVPAVLEVLSDWWRIRQPAWAQTINRVYGQAGKMLLQPVNLLRRRPAGNEQSDRLQEYRDAEWWIVQQTVQQVMQQLERLQDTGGAALQQRVRGMLSGDATGALLSRLLAEHKRFDQQQELRELVDRSMQQLESERPELYRMLRRINHVSAAVRPVTSAVLFSVGFGPAGDLLAPLASQAVMHTAADVFGGTAAAIAGEAVVTTAAESGVGIIQSWFCRLQAGYSARRATWLAGQLQQHLLGDLAEEICRAASVVESEDYRMVAVGLDQMQQLTGRAMSEQDGRDSGETVESD